jgi:hypothetical protein
MRLFDEAASRRQLSPIHILYDKHLAVTYRFCCNISKSAMQVHSLLVYSSVLKKTWQDIPLVKPPKASRIPDILSVAQIQQLIYATRQLSYMVFFFTAYSPGLRLGEGIRLKTGDIDNINMRVHIRDAKGNKDRLFPLPLKTLFTLRNFWSVHRHPEFLFPNRKPGLKNAHLVETPLGRGGIQSAISWKLSLPRCHPGKGHPAVRRRYGDLPLQACRIQTVQDQNRERREVPLSADAPCFAKGLSQDTELRVPSSLQQETHQIPSGGAAGQSVPHTCQQA